MSKIFCVIVAFINSYCFAQEEISLFDEETLKGWEMKPEDKEYWSVENGSIVGYNKGKKIPRNTYLFTEEKYEHFEFKCKFRLTGDEETGVINSGVQFRTQNKNWEPVGYQADIGGPSWWGGIFEEGGRRKLAQANMKKVLPVVKVNDWNDYLIRANGPRIQLFINGLETVGFLETVSSVPYKGHFALQLHKGGAAKIEFKDITLKKLNGGVDPSDKNAWAAAKNRITFQELQVSKDPKTPAEELKGFSVSEGFEVELVAEESEGIGKFIAVDFDSEGKMWSMTALDYPVDAKKDKKKSQNLFKNGGKDKILIFDTPTAKGIQKPRVFAQNLAIPLGVMPYKNGAIAQYGPDIRHYKDTDGDGKADEFDVLLTGFGIEDSHLFPHQFTRGPGGWMYLAQGLGNFSNVVRPDGSAFANGSKSVKYDRCRLARMQLDGSDFQYTTTGPNNIWGVVPGRDGEWFIQEANDKGYPIAKYDFGVYLNTGGTAKIKPYQPILPPIFKTAIMGGTGLSGLVLSEDIDSSFSQDGKKTFYLANPLTSSVQVVTGTPLANNRFKWEKQEPLLTSSDKWFRPVGIKFGPDGAIYVVDWYNKIIAHGEVPQNHPERDKVRGRIWRITPKGHKYTASPNIAKASEEALFTYLSDKNALIQRLSWLEIIDRKSTSLIPKLKENTLDPAQRIDVRLASLWACEGIGGVNTDLLNTLINDKVANLRAEIVRVAGRVADVKTFGGIAKMAANDQSVRVRNALGEALVSRLEHSADTMQAAALLGKQALLSGDPLSIYEREFERFLARWAMENNPEQTTQMLGEVLDLPVENRLLAMQSLKPEDAVLAFLPMVAKIDRDLSTTELSLITSQLKQELVLNTFKKLLFEPSRQKNMIAALSKADPDLGDDVLESLLAEACRELVKRDGSVNNKLLVIKTAQRYVLTDLKADIANWISESEEIGFIKTGFSSLRELGSVDSLLCEKFASHADESVQREAIISLATSEGTGTVANVLKHWEVLSATDKQSAIRGLINSKAKAVSFSQEILKGSFGELDNGSIEKLIIVLNATPEAKELMKKLGGNVPMIISMTGVKEDYVDTNINLKGTFTIETWVKISEKKVGSATLLVGPVGEGLHIQEGKLKMLLTGSKPRVLISSKSKANPNLWNHYAIVRDQNGKLKIYIDGVLNSSSKKGFRGEFKGLDLGMSEGAKIDFLEFRVWNTAKNETEIRESMGVSYVGGKTPAGLQHRVSGDLVGLALKGSARVAPASDAPALMTSEKAAERVANFKKYKAIIVKNGDADNGKKMFARTCTGCHMVNNIGGKLGPDLSGIGTSTDEGLLRNILTPSSALETSYYSHLLKMKDGSLVSGFMVKEDEQSITIRQLGVDDKVISKAKIDTHSISKRSLMPEGLLNGMTNQEVADMFSYMRTLKGE